jgi:hypothetical protein
MSTTTNIGCYHRAVSVATGLALAVGCGSASVGARQPAPLPALSQTDLSPFYIPGETITWEVSFRGIQGGKARIAVGTPGTDDGRQVVVLRGEAQSAGLLEVVRKVRDNASSWVDLTTGLPLRTESDSELAGKRLITRSHRHPSEPRADIVFWRDDGLEQRRQQTLPPKTYDPMSALMAIRGWNAPDGAEIVIHALGGVRMWRTVITVEAREELDTSVGRRKTIRIRGTSTRLTPDLSDDLAKPPRSFTVWLSDDKDRIPLRIAAQTEYGEVVVRATSYTRP